MDEEHISTALLHSLAHKASSLLIPGKHAEAERGHVVKYRRCPVAVPSATSLNHFAEDNRFARVKHTLGASQDEKLGPLNVNLHEPDAIDEAILCGCRV